MAAINTSKLDQQLEGIFTRFQGTTPEQFNKAIEARAERFSAFERTCLEATHAAATVRTGEAANDLYDAWRDSLSPMDAQTERESAFWSWTDAAVESALATAQ